MQVDQGSWNISSQLRKTNLMQDFGRRKQNQSISRKKDWHTEPWSIIALGILNPKISKAAEQLEVRNAGSWSKFCASALEGIAACILPTQDS